MWGCDGHTGECPDYVIQYQMSVPHMPPVLHSEWTSMLHCQIISKHTAKKAPIFEIAERKLHNNSLKVTVLLVRKKPKLTQWEWVQSRPSECHSQSVRPSPLSGIAATSCHDDSPLTSSATNSGVKIKYLIIQPKFQVNHYSKHPEFLWHFQKQQEESVMDKLNFLLACPCTSKHLS
jgi:hypothetical protein